jgi:hypothetical protein
MPLYSLPFITLSFLSLNKDSHSYVPIVMISSGPISGLLGASLTSLSSEPTEKSISISPPSFNINSLELSMTSSSENKSIFGASKIGIYSVSIESLLLSTFRRSDSSPKKLLGSKSFSFFFDLTSLRIFPLSFVLYFSSHPFCFIPSATFYGTILSQRLPLGKLVLDKMMRWSLR